MENNRSAHYDKVSRIYDISRAANAETVEKLVSLLHVNSDSVLLDLGCGTGNYTFALQKVAKRVVGIDISRGMIEQARVKFPALEFICADVTDLPFDPESFDGAFSIQVIHHVKDKETFLREAHRILKKEACLAIHSCSHEQFRAFWFYHYFPKGVERDIERTPDVEEISRMLKRAGFLDVGIVICYQDVVVAHEMPDSYLDKNYRDGISTFALLTEEEIKLGCEKLREDISSGAVEAIIQQGKARVASAGGSSIIYGKRVNPF